MTRGELKKRIKWGEGLDPTREDGLLSSDLLNTAINDAIKRCAEDLNLIPAEATMALRSDQYKYPLPSDMLRIYRVWYIDSNEVHTPLRYLNPTQFYDFFDSDDTSDEPIYYGIGNYQGAVIEFWKNSVVLYDFVSSGTITTASVRTVIDSAANFGKTRTGRKIEPGAIVHNTTDGSYGAVDCLDISTNVTTGTATANTSTNSLVDTGKNFITLGVEEHDIICTPSTGAVTAYAFVTEVGTTTLTYSDFKSVTGTVYRFKSGDTYKVGTADRIRLSTTAPNYGLRNGAVNTFAVDDAYQIEDKWRDERVLLLSPTPSDDDTIGEESILIQYSAVPQLPTDDSHIIEIPEQFYEALFKCATWQTGKLSSKFSAIEVEGLQVIYEREAMKYKGDTHKPPSSETINVWENRKHRGGRGARSDSSITGVAYNLDSIL